MDNQENQTGPMPGDDVRTPNAGNTTGSSGVGNNATGAAAARKAGGASGQARGGAQAGGQGSSDTTASAGSDRQGEGEQTNGQEGKFLDTALQSGKKWIEDSGVLNSVNGLPQNVKEWGTRAISRVGDLTTTQKIVGGALLAAGIGYLATRKGKSSSAGSSSADYGRQSGGSYGRRNYGYQSPDASTSRGTTSGASSRSDSGSPYGNSGSRYGGSGSNYGSGSSYNSGASAGANQGTSGGDHGSRTSESSYRKNDDFRSIE
ncbi:MAG: hypothetical protein JWR44_3228 [Hymenobacter sp.]|jgi:hypothetical protein|nr:hypothetical protein [Hymenobacter sp.]